MPNVPRTVPEKPKNRKKVLTRLWRYLYQYKWHLLAALLLTISSNLLALIGPTLSGRAIDAIGVKAGGVDFQTVIFYCIDHFLRSILPPFLHSLSPDDPSEPKGRIPDAGGRVPPSFPFAHPLF